MWYDEEYFEKMSKKVDAVFSTEEKFQLFFELNEKIKSLNPNNTKTYDLFELFYQTNLIFVLLNELSFILD